jgi:pancreatic triacylglycerol lipase
MKRLVCLLLSAILAGTVVGAPLDGNESQLVMVPDSNGQFILVDLNTYEVDESLEKRFTAVADMVFYLYTRRNPTTPQILRINDLASVTNSNFNRIRPTR